jgi:hypothetical protein
MYTGRAWSRPLQFISKGMAGDDHRHCHRHCSGSQAQFAAAAPRAEEFFQQSNASHQPGLAGRRK